MDKKSHILTIALLLLAISFFGFEAEAAKSKLKGSLYAVNTTAKTLTIKDKSDALIILSITPDAKIKRYGSIATLTDLVLGDKVICDDDGLFTRY